MSGARLELDLRIRRSSRNSDPFELSAQIDHAGGMTLICGSSGSGKSTLLLGLLGALRPERGAIRIGGRTLFDDVSGIDLPVRRRRLGIVFQDALLFPHMTVSENVAFGLSRAARGTRLATVTDWLERVGAADLARRFPSGLSGGERQRVALARALAAEPAGLLLDEPFSALDPAARRELGELLLRLQEDSGIPFLHVTHDLGEALRLGTHLVLLEAGRVVQSGPPGKVIANPRSLVAARSLGTENLFRGTVIGDVASGGGTVVEIGGTRLEIPYGPEPAGAALALGLRAEEILVSLDLLERTSARNVIEGEVQAARRVGPLVELEVATPLTFRVLVTPASVDALTLEPGKRVYLVIKAASIHRLC